MTASTVWQDVARLLTASATTDGQGRPTWDTPGQLAHDLDPRTVATPALDLIDQALTELADTPDGRLIISMPPQEGKSQRASRRFPLWALTRDPDLRVAIASYEHNVARRWGRAIRDDITQHSTVVRLDVRADVSAQNEWQIDRCADCWEGKDGQTPPPGKHRPGHDGGVYTTGVGGALTGRAVDLLIIDDPVKDRLQAESALYRQRVWDWWTDVASTRLAPGAPVVLILTRWHHDDLAGRLMAAEDGHLWRYLNIPAQAEDDDDPLDRELGEFMDSARGRTLAQWAAIKVRSGARTWASLYQGRPTPDTGNLFPSDGWARYDRPLWITRDDGARVIPGLNPETEELVQSWDFTFKDTAGTDYVVGQVWLRRGQDAYLLDQVRRRMSFTESCQAMIDLTARWPQAIAKLVEDKANGPAILNALRSKVGGLIPVEPEGSKYARAVAVSPFVEARNVKLPDPAAVEGTAWVTDMTEEARDFPQAANDDTVDAFSQAVHRLLLVPILSGQTYDEHDLLPDLEDDLDWATTDY